MEWFLNNPSQSLITMGIVLLIIEVVVMGFSTFILTFIGLSLVITGTGVYLGMLSGDLMTIVISNAIVASVVAIVLWKPLKRFQNKVDTTPVSNDLVGITFTLAQDIDASTAGKHRLSGVEWQVKSHSAITAGSNVIVDKAEVGVLWVSQQ